MDVDYGQSVKNYQLETVELDAGVDKTVAGFDRITNTCSNRVAQIKPDHFKLRYYRCLVSGLRFLVSGGFDIAETWPCV